MKRGHVIYLVKQDKNDGKTYILTSYFIVNWTLSAKDSFNRFRVRR